MTEIVAPNDIANRLGVTGLQFRNWLREQKAAGHPLVASHVYRSRYQFTPAEANQLAAEFSAQVLRNGKQLTELIRGRPSTTRPVQPKKNDANQPLIEHPRSDDPGHRTTVDWIGQKVETLADLLRAGLSAVAVGINPAPISVAVGHYYQGQYGQTFFRRLRKAGLLPDGDGFEDDRAFAAGIGFTDLVKRRTPSAGDLRTGELEHGRTLLEAKLTAFEVPLVIFVFKSAAEILLGPLPPYFYGLVSDRRLGPARVFIMPGPTAAREAESDAIKNLKRLLRSAP